MLLLLLMSRNGLQWANTCIMFDIGNDYFLLLLLLLMCLFCVVIALCLVGWHFCRSLGNGMLFFGWGKFLRGLKKGFELPIQKI